DGTETLKAIRELESGLNVTDPVICLTADAIRGARERYIAEGFTDYLTKPVEGRLLEKMLLTYLPEDKTEVYTSEEQSSGVTDPVIKSLEKAGFNTDKALVYTQNDTEFYKTILSGFARDFEDRSGKLDALCREGKLTDYSVIVHALKSNARTIGAEKLAEEAASLEALSKSGEGDEVLKGHGPAMKLYEETVMTIRSILSEDGNDGEDDTDPEVMEFSPEEGDVLEFIPDTDRGV
ncbi:MAG: Hpt domain-containing protein, partial [Lachnospiraceae bacterium]|nr:Hpt domain-containing protein [Lachnospiraceae bacterium]